eukprot:TRINITY_DN12656_c0_g1_i13.p1 TRINITY_DN12656_c0_g1~~TRINITY_DN12656_c0_g1_i13.p1  ORF type:complete len:283 (+),score=45.38 TRINITY_DN12656_c0_g1_i13:70-918(+)
MCIRDRCSVSMVIRYNIMYGNKGCCGKFLLLLPAIIAQVFIIYAVFGYFRYFLTTVSKRGFKILLTIVMGFLSKIFELSYLLTIFINPGSIDPEWSNKNLKNVKLKSDSDREEYAQLYPSVDVSAGEGRYDYCFKCHTVKPERAHHCSSCNKCYLKMDHHCPWMGNCIGLYNHKYFLKTLLFGTILGIMMIATWSKDVFKMMIADEGDTTYRRTTLELTIILTSYMLSAVLLLSCLIMLIDQSYLAFHNTTSVEQRVYGLSLIHICRCRRYAVCRSRWSPYH